MKTYDWDSIMNSPQTEYKTDACLKDVHRTLWNALRRQGRKVNAGRQALAPPYVLTLTKTANGFPIEIELIRMYEQTEMGCLPEKVVIIRSNHAE